jgi:uncharacterized protein
MKEIFKAIVGSQAYGTSTPTSDTDYKGVYMQDISELIGFGYKDQVEVGKDECYYEVRRFLQLLQTANPTVLELLYSPIDCIIKSSSQFDEIVKCRDLFLTKKCLHSFGGYAIAQIKKAKGLDKKINWEQSRVERKTPLDFCYVITPLGTKPLLKWLSYQRGFYAPKQEYYGVVNINNARDLYFIYPDEDGNLGYRGIINESESSNTLRLSSVPKEQTLKGVVMYYNKDGYTQHCVDFKQYSDWLKNRNTQRYVDTKNHNQKIDGKNLLHCRRLLDVAMEIATQKTINVRRSNADYLLSIRKGEVPLEEIIEKAELDIKGLDKLFEDSDLPNDCDQEKVNELLLKIRYL